MINQLLCGVHIAAAAEAMHVAERAGVPLATMHEIISVSAGNSWMWGDRGPRMMQDDPPVTSAVDIFVKDLGIVLDEARALKARACRCRLRRCRCSSPRRASATARPTTAR